MAFLNCEVFSKTLNMATALRVILPDEGELGAANTVYLLHGLSGLDGNGRTPFGTGFVVFDGQGKRFPVFALFRFQPRSTGSDLIIRRRSLDGDFKRLILFAEKSTQYLAEIHIMERLSPRRFAACACRQGQYDGKAFG